ncbi:2823_t:CDS:10 [Paraglomus brasilianum]|uniref:2823_t:CDS:1 n=1 Tax=Paraglomus brasilianum TaxID=144538 RepID=A0A9N9C4L6_9GLOM|nr:2823_t:CDS:10 [Paraglomus brasilianum]
MAGVNNQSIHSNYTYSIPSDQGYYMDSNYTYSLPWDQMHYTDPDYANSLPPVSRGSNGIYLQPPSQVCFPSDTGPLDNNNISTSENEPFCTPPYGYVENNKNRVNNSVLPMNYNSSYPGANTLKPVMATTISFPHGIRYKAYWANNDVNDWSVESFDMFWIQKNPFLHQRRAQARTALAKELGVLDTVSNQQVKDRVKSLRKQLKKKSSKISKIVWERSEEIAKSKVGLTLSELIAKMDVKMTIVDEIGKSERQKRKRSIKELDTEDEVNEDEDRDEVDLLEQSVEVSIPFNTLDTCTPAWIVDACQAIQKIRKMDDGHESPMWWRILDVRSDTKRVGAAHMRAKELVTEETLEMLMPRKIILRGIYVNETTNVILNRIQSMSVCQMMSQLQEFPVVGTIGIVRNLFLVTDRHADQVSLEELLADSDDETDIRVGKSDAKFGEDLLITNEKIEELARHEDIIGLSFCLYETIRYLKSDALHTKMSERTIDIHIYRSLFEMLRIGNLVQIHYGEAESRASRARRERILREIESKKTPRGDKYDWLIASFLLRPNEVRGIEMGIAENIGPNHAETGKKPKKTAAKVFKGNRDQWEELKNIIREEAGGSLTNTLLKGLSAVPMIGITLVNLTIRAHLVYNTGGNLFAVSEFGRCRLPDTIDTLPSVVECIRLFIQIRNVMKHSADIIQALLKKAKDTRNSVLHTTCKDDIPTIDDLGTPAKPKTKANKKRRTKKYS